LNSMIAMSEHSTTSQGNIPGQLARPLGRGNREHSRLEGAPPCALRRLIDHFAAHHSHNDPRVFDSLGWDAEEVIREDNQVAEFPG
jgi:hypothetical protein